MGSVSTVPMCTQSSMEVGRRWRYENAWGGTRGWGAGGCWGRRVDDPHAVGTGGDEFGYRVREGGIGRYVEDGE